MAEGLYPGTEWLAGTEEPRAVASGERSLAAHSLRDRFSESLPKYMVPAAFHWRNSLPLTDNSKIDRKALTALAAQLDVASPREIMGEGGSGLEPVRCISRGEQNHEGPSTATEHWLAAAWAEVLGIPKDQIGRR